MFNNIKNILSIQKNIELLQIGFVKLAEEFETLKKTINNNSVDEESLKKLQNKMDELKVSTTQLETALSTSEQSNTVTISST